MCADETANAMHVDATLSLTFCTPVRETIRLKCGDGRKQLRVIGQIHETGEALTSVDDTAAFCACANDQFRRARVDGKYAHADDFWSKYLLVCLLALLSPLLGVRQASQSEQPSRLRWHIFGKVKNCFSVLPFF